MNNILKKSFIVVSIMAMGFSAKAEKIWSIDFAKGDKTLKLYNGAKIVTDKGKRVLDLGYKQPGSKAYATAEVPVADLRSGSISFKFRPGYHLLKKRKSGDTSDYRCILQMPTGNGFIQVDWYNRFGPWLHFYIKSCTNDTKNLQTGLQARTPGAKKMNVTADTWKEVVINWTPKQTKMFLDGKLVGERIVAGVTPAELLKGIIYMGAWGKFDAGDLQLADIAIYNTVETPESIKNQGQRVIAVGGPGTLLYANPRKHYQAPKFAKSPKIDGILDDVEWSTAPSLTGFVRNTIGRQYADKQSIAKIGWDDQNLYIGIKYYENKMNNLRTLQTKHDGAVYSDDACEIIIVPDNNAIKQYYQFIVNAIGTRFDTHRTNVKYNPQWNAATKKNKDSWTAEIVIPFKSLTKQKVVNGSTMRFNICRDRQAGNGIDNLSASAEIGGGFLQPEEYDYLDFVNKLADVAGFEKDLNKNFVEDTLTLLKKKSIEAEKDTNWGIAILRNIEKSGSKMTKEIQEAKKLSGMISAKVEELKRVINDKEAKAEHLAAKRTTLDELDDLLKIHSDKINGIGFGSMDKVPANLPNGISRKAQFSFIKANGIVMAVDNSTGMITGIFDGKNKRISAWSFDIYNLNTKRVHVQSDERMDTVKKSYVADGKLVFECYNSALKLNIKKAYFLPKKSSAPGRIVSKTIEATGKVSEYTLLSVVSRLRFDNNFLKNAVYHRVIPAGVLGEKRAFIKAADIKHPVALNFFFTHATPALLTVGNLVEKNGISQYWYTADGNWVLPQGSHEYQTILTSTAWDMSHFITFIGPKAVKAEIRYHIFDGNHVNFHSEYRDSPARLEALETISPVARIAKFRRYLLNVGVDAAQYKKPHNVNKEKFELLYPRLRSNEYASHFGMPNMDRWHGDYPAANGKKIRLDYKPNAKTIPAEEVKAIIAQGNAMWPQVQSGWYHSPQNICYHSELAKEKPYLLMKGKDGNPVPGGWSPFMGIGNYTDEYWNLVAERLCKQMDYFQTKVMYLDYSVFGALPDWGNGRVIYSINHIKFLRKLYEEVHKRGGYLFTNGVTTDGIHDVTYYEGWGNFREPTRTWKDTSDALLLRRLYERKDVRTIPLYWYGGNQWSAAQRNYRDYTNMILSQLLAPIECWHDPYHLHFKDPATGKTDWKAVYAHSVPYFDFSFEVGWTRLANVNLHPNWYLNETDTLEAYCFKKSDNCHIFTALRHEAVTEPAKTLTITADADKLKLDNTKNTFVWHMLPRDPDKYPRRGGKQPENWDKLFSMIRCETITPANNKVQVKMNNAPSFLTYVSVVTQTPAVFVSLENKPLVTMLPELLDNKLSGTLAKGAKSYKLTAETILPAEILVYLPVGTKNKVAVNGKQTAYKVEKYGNMMFGKIALAKGKSDITVK